MVSQIGGGEYKSASSRRQLPITEFAHKAGVVRDAGFAAILTPLDVTAQCSRTTRLDGRHDTAVFVGQVSGWLGAISGAVVAEDVRHLQHRPHRRQSVGRCDRET